MTRSMILAALAVTLAACAPTQEAKDDAFWRKAERDQQQRLVNGLPQSDRLECDMHAQMAAASASDQRVWIDLNAITAAESMKSTCLRMKIARQHGG